MRKAPVKLSPPTNQHPSISQAGCPSCHPTNSVKALMGRVLTGRARKTAMKRCVCSDTCLCTRYRDNDGEAGCLCVRSADDGGKLATDELTDLYRQTDRQTHRQTSSEIKWNKTTL